MKTTAILTTTLILPVMMTACMHEDPANAPTVAVAAELKTPDKAEVIRRVMSLPAYALHEETVESFRNRLEKESTYTPLPGQGAALLSIGGDGCSGERIFRLEGDGTLHILIHVWEDHPEPYFNTAKVAPGSTKIQYGPSGPTPPAIFSPKGKELEDPAYKTSDK